MAFLGAALALVVFTPEAQPQPQVQPVLTLTPKAKPCQTVSAAKFNRLLKQRVKYGGKPPKKWAHKPVCVRPNYRRLQAQVNRQKRLCGGGTPASNRCLGRLMAAAVGWVGQQWQCLDTLWGTRESGWDHTADNPTSDAYGIPQALPGSKMGPGWQDNPRVQIRWGLSYIRGRYKTPCNALAHSYANNWY